MAAPKAIRFIAKLLESAAGGAPVWVYDQDLCGPVLYFNGIPVYAGQNIMTEMLGTGSGLTSIWAVKLSGPTGVRLLHSVGSSDNFGVDVVDVPMQDPVPKYGKLVGGHYSLLVPEKESIAQLQGCDLSSLI